MYVRCRNNNNQLNKYPTTHKDRNCSAYHGSCFMRVVAKREKWTTPRPVHCIKPRKRERRRRRGCAVARKESIRSTTNNNNQQQSPPMDGRHNSTVAPCCCNERTGRNVQQPSQTAAPKTGGLYPFPVSFFIMFNNKFPGTVYYA